MKSNPKILLAQPGPPKRQDSLQMARQRALMAGQRAHRNRVTLWRAGLIGTFAIAAVFAALEGLRQPPPKPEPVEAIVTADPPAAKPVAVVQPRLDEQPTPVAAWPMPEVEPAQALPPAIAADSAPEPDAAARMSAEAPLLLTGMDSTRDAAKQRDRDLLHRAIQGGAWDAYRGLLAKSMEGALANLRDGSGLNRFDGLWASPPVYQALLRWRTLGWFPESTIQARVNDLYTGGFLAWLLTHEKAMEELLLTMHPGDDGGAVLAFLMETWSANQETFEKYFPLALACAVVFDRPMSIPHPIGVQEYGAEASVDPLKRYLWYVEKNEKGKLAAPVHHSSARDLVWAVCAPVTTSELEWSISKMHKHRKNWGSAYGDVTYLMERAVEGLNPYEEYSFEEILKEGGICGDQAYFCVNTARAQGIPAMILAGETDLGGHAWAGLKIDSREWTTGVGRIGGVSKGEAHNPQTGGSITEQEIQLWNDRHHQSPATTIALHRHLWLADFFSAIGQHETGGEVVRLANRIGRSFPESWRALYSVLEREMELTGEPAVPNNLDEWKSFAADMRREFKDNPRMAELAANAEMEYIFPYSEEGEAGRALLRERRRIERNSGEQADLIAGSLKREADLIQQRGGPDVKRDIGRLYDRALRDYGGSITGFKTMAEDYFSFLKDDPVTARKAARDIELAFKRVVETGTKDWFRANTESSIYRMICGYYRAAGDNDRADMLEKRYQVLLRRSKRSAL